MLLLRQRHDLINVQVFGFLLLVGICCGSQCIQNSYIKDAGPLVKTNTGVVIGKYINVFDTEVAAFLGIPFAEPPLGEKRFMKADPIEPWEGTVFATEKPPMCQQYSSRNFGWVPPPSNSSEDCLFLSIWSPTKRCTKTDKLPVLVWIHGGGFYSGSSSLDLYDGGVLASYGEVIVVTMNYRVGIFGFLNGGTSEAPGNAGLHDQLLALQWINANIHHFGGDPNSVTLLGESAGSMSVSMHMISPLSRNLFHRAILQSGTAYQPQTSDNPTVSLFKANTFAEVIGCSNEQSNFKNSPNEVIRCLKARSSSELAQAEDIFTSKYPLFFMPSYGDSCEGCSGFLPESPIKSMNSGKLLQIPVLVGGNQNEATIFLNYIMPDVFKLDQKPILSLPQAKNILKALFSVAPAVPSDKVFEFYFQNITEDGSDDVARAIADAFGDYVFTCPGMFLAEKAKEAYVYWLTHRSSTDPNHKWLGVPHFSGIPFMFGKPIADPQSYSLEDRKTSENFMQKYTSFVLEGSPMNKDSTQTWPKFSTSNPVAYQLNPKSGGLIQFPRKEACEFWRPYIENETS